MPKQWNPRSRSQTLSGLRGRSDTDIGFDYVSLDQRDPIRTEQVIPMIGAHNAGRAMADEGEFLEGAGIRTLSQGFVSRPPKGTKRVRVSMLNDHTKQVPKGTKSDRAASEVKVTKGAPLPKVDRAQVERNIRQGF